MDLPTSRSQAAKRGAGVSATDLLRQDHETVSELFDRYEAAIEEQSAERQELAEKICNELEIHAEIEEEIFYPRVQDHEEDLVLEALEEHNEMKELIAQLKSMSASDSEYDETMLKLMEVVEHHVEEEEDKMFPRVEEEIADSLTALGAELEQRKHELRLERGLA